MNKYFAKRVANFKENGELLAESMADWLELNEQQLEEEAREIYTRGDQETLDASVDEYIANDPERMAIKKIYGNLITGLSHL